MKTVQPWQEEMSTIVLQVNAKLTKFKVTQTTIASLLEEPTTVEIVDIARECVKQMDKDVIGLKVDFVKFTKKIKQILKVTRLQVAQGRATSEC